MTATLAVAACAILATTVLREAQGVRYYRWHVDGWTMFAATLLEVALLTWGVYLWSLVLARFEGPRPRFGAMLRVWVGTNLAKYLPGSIWPVATAVSMAEGAGASPVALPAAFLLHALFTALGAAAVASALLTPTQLAGHGLPRGVESVLGIAALVLVHPAVLNQVVGLGARRARRPPPAWHGRWHHGVGLLALYAATWIGYGTAFVLFVSALAPLSRGAWLTLVGANALAFVVGFAAFFAPGGIGVRELVLTGLLVHLLPGGVGMLIAAGSRLWLVGAELAGSTLILAVWGGSSALRARTRRDAPPRQAEPRPAPRVRLADPPPGFTRGNRVEVLTDTSAALGRIAAAVRGAERSVWIAQLAFDADCLCAAGDEGAAGERLVDALIAAAAERDGSRGAEVRVLLNGSILMNTATALRRHLSDAGADAARVMVRGVDVFPQIMHAKLVVIDGAEAFLVGSPFVNGYWDDASHHASIPGRTDEDLAGRPIHDLSAHVRGPAVHDLAAWFTQLWNATAEGPGIPALQAPRARQLPDDPGASVRVVRTLPAGVMPDLPGGSQEILDAYLEAIAGARSLIYLENQYFSARPIREALSRALEARPELEVVLVVNQNPDITAYRSWQNRRMAEGGLLAHPRVGVFSLWSAGPGRGPHRVELTQLFIHSKTAVIDDAWATFGTANLDGVSLHSYGDDFSGWLGRRVFRGVRNIDLNLVLLDGLEGERAGGAVGALRRQLWAQQLGVTGESVEHRPAEGWLPLWRSVAAANAAALARGEVPTGRVLPYTTAPRPRAQLRALGIDTRAAGIDLRFDPGWVEVLWSPGWAKKVIPEPIRRRFTRRRS